MKLIKKAMQNIQINSSSLNCQNIIVTIGCVSMRAVPTALATKLMCTLRPLCEGGLGECEDERSRQNARGSVQS